MPYKSYESSCSIQYWSHIFPSFLFNAYVFMEAFLLPLISLASTNFCVLILCLRFLRISLFIHASILTSFLDLLLSGFECSVAWRKYSLNINHLFFGSPLPSKALFHGIILTRSLERSKSALPKSRVVILLFVLLILLGIPYSTIS